MTNRSLNFSQYLLNKYQKARIVKTQNDENTAAPQASSCYGLPLIIQISAPSSLKCYVLKAQLRSSWVPRSGLLES